MTTTTAPRGISRHPIRGALYGLLLGLGIATYLVIFSVITFGWLVPVIVTMLGVVVGVAWSLFAPPKGTAPPVTPASPPPDPLGTNPLPEPPPAPSGPSPGT